MGDSDMNGPGTISIRESVQTGPARRSSTAKLLVARGPVISARLLDATMVTFSVLCRRRFDRFSVRQLCREIVERGKRRAGDNLLKAIWVLGPQMTCGAMSRGASIPCGCDGD